jgi:hypothetical protein
MAPLEDNTHVFIVRIWLERREIEGAAAEWRGVIEHVLSGERHYVRDLDDISANIAPILEEMGVDLGTRWRPIKWLRQLKSRLTRHS